MIYNPSNGTYRLENYNSYPLIREIPGINIANFQNQAIPNKPITIQLEPTSVREV